MRSTLLVKFNIARMHSIASMVIISILIGQLMKFQLRRCKELNVNIEYVWKAFVHAFVKV